MRTANPALNAKTFDVACEGAQVMTIQGTVSRTAMLLALLFAATLLTWSPAATETGSGWAVIGGIAGFVVALITIFNKKAAPFTAPLYAVCQGVMLGGISSLFEARFPGIVMQAVLLTFGTLGALLLAYTSRLIKVTENFKLGIVAATGGIALFYLASMILGFFGVQIPMIYGSGPIGIGFSAVVVVIAALNLVLDFDFIEQGAEQGAPKYMEWYAAFGLIVTLVWLYLEILRLLSKLQSRR
ncbi:MAG: Bax inhibitor-1/YccA family protein [Verrucomicrobia bacterium]|nr:Bax inhibitor-1/YccA family protein [Verrucomicrobiota bacterium]